MHGEADTRCPGVARWPPRLADGLADTEGDRLTRAAALVMAAVPGDGRVLGDGHGAAVVCGAEAAVVCGAEEVAADGTGDDGAGALPAPYIQVPVAWALPGLSVMPDTVAT